MIPFVNPYVIIGLLVAWIATGAYAYHKGQQAAENEAKIETQALVIAGFKSEIEILRKASAVNESAAEAWQIKVQENEQELAESEQQIEELRRALENMPPAPAECLYTPDDIKRMQNGRGKASRGGAGRAAAPAR